MKVILINAWKSSGGAARAAFRLRSALNLLGVTVIYQYMRPVIKFSFSNSFRYVRSLICPTLDRLPTLFYPNRCSSSPWSNSWFGGLDELISEDPSEIIHLHWVAGGVLSVNAIAKFTNPVVWTLHDMAPFTGGCHYSQGCNQWIDGCKQCHLLSADRKTWLSSFNLKRKIRLLGKKRLLIVAPSRWIAECAKKSPVFANSIVYSIPNTIDLHKFSPLDKLESRKKLGISIESKIILFGAVSSLTDPRKGADLLHESLKLIGGRLKNISFVIFGTDTGIEIISVGVPVVNMGSIKDDVFLATLYSAADIFACPSREENLSNAVMESLACGTPVIAYDIGGMPDLIEHKSNGYLARPFSIEDFTTGIQFVLENTDNINFTKNSRLSVEAKYSEIKIAEEHKEVYASFQ